MSGLFIGHPQLRKTGPRDMFEDSLLYCFSAAAFWLKWTSIYTLFFRFLFFGSTKGRREDHPVPPLPPSPAILLLWVCSWWPNWSDSTVQTIPYCPIELEGRFIWQCCSFLLCWTHFQRLSNSSSSQRSTTKIQFFLIVWASISDTYNTINKKQKPRMNNEGTTERVNTQSNTKKEQEKNKNCLVHYV